MPAELTTVRYPELVIGIAGPIGIDIDEICLSLTDALGAVDYTTHTIRITDEIREEATTTPKPTGTDFYEVMGYKMDHASAVCRERRSADTLMKFAIRAIREHRASQVEAVSHREDEDAPKPQDRVLAKKAYIIRQLKRPEEVALLRRVYGRQFVLISAYGSVESRRRIIETKLKRSLSFDKAPHEIVSMTEHLIHRDANEGADKHGQHLRETFHLADVFIDGVNKSAMSAKTARFVNAFFGKADIAPTKAEYGMYAAKSASLRSSDLSRQVGAAIFTSDGEVIAQGCNEVPKAFGGTYWDDEEPDYRDIKLGYDPNDILKREVVRDLMERLQRADLLSDAAAGFANSQELVDALLKKPAANPPPQGHGALYGASITDLTEYGRVVHAEMCAICDAARLGRAVKDAILYVTTFPCHNCTKHILAAGIKTVIYMEPYPKSRAQELHENEISIEREDDSRVSFLPFLGISPQRYRDIFQKGKRKADGNVIIWYEDGPKPMLDVPAPTYTELEELELGSLFGRIEPVDTPTQATGGATGLDEAV
jgi:deoxycytidylate deaminase